MPTLPADLRSSWLKLAVALLALSPSALAARPQVNGWDLPPDASADGYRIDSLIRISLIFMAVLFAIMVAWMLYACIRHGRRHLAQHSDGTSRAGKALPLGIAAFVLLVVDGNLFLNSTRDMEHIFWNFERAEADPAAVRIEVNARQWAWEARYAGPDGKFATPDDIATLNEIRIPVGAPILIQLGAVDVVHSFYLPNFRVKMDAVPGTLHRVWFRPQEAGEFELACAQHCGTNHYKMKATVLAVSPDEFSRWQAEASVQALRAYDPEDTQAHWGWDWKTATP